MINEPNGSVSMIKENNTNRENINRQSPTYIASIHRLTSETSSTYTRFAKRYVH